MNAYQNDGHVTVFPFTQKPEGEETIIANVTQTSFLAVPSSAVDLLMWLYEGKTIGEAQLCYQQKHGECPDIEDFLELLEQEGFLAWQTNLSEAQGLATVSASRPMMHAHFAGLSEKNARIIFSKPMLASMSTLIVLGLFLVILEPSLFPSFTTLVFQDHTGPLLLSVLLFTFLTLFLHEVAHLVAARAAGVPARLGIGHRLWILVAETDITGIWMASPAQRYLAFLAGPLLDMVGVAVCLILLFMQRHGWFPLSPIGLIFCQSALLSYVFRLLWQCYFFVRTDLYYVFVTLFKCKNLMQDTEAWLSNLLARFLPFFKHRNISALAPREMKVIRLYSAFWIVGRIVALYTLLFLTLPILVGYVKFIPVLFSPASPLEHLPLVDALAWVGVAMIIVVPQIMGLFLWLRSLIVRKG